MSGVHLIKARLRSLRFASFLSAQFLGAVNDNAFKATLTSFVLWKFTDEATQVRFSSLATALFPLPFLLFSPLAGYLSDRFRKSGALALTKAPEIVAMGLAIVALGTGSLPLLMLVLFLMATQSAFFSPPKYGLLPESFEHRDLSMANGLLQMTTNLAILIGSVLGIVAFGVFRENLGRAGWLYVGIAVAGTLAALHVPRTPAGNRAAAFEWFVLRAAWRDWQVVRDRPELVQTIAGIAYFYFLGSVFLAVIPVWGHNVLGLSVERSAALLMVLSIGIAVGSLAAGRLSHGRVEIGLVPLGSLGITVFSLALVAWGDGAWTLGGIPLTAIVLLLLLGAAAGLFNVPLNALLQERSPEGMKGRLIAFSNVVTFAAVLLAAGTTWVLTDFFGLRSLGLVLSVSLLTLAVTVYILTLLPDYFVRLVLYLTTNTLYRLEVSGEENVRAGGALLVANHVSWVDAFLVGAASDRMVRFLMYRPYYEARPLNWFFKKMRMIPIAGGDPPERKEASLAMAREEIRNGHVVCIFAEGAVTRTGNLLKFRRGFERIADGLDAPIVPVCLDGVWGSIFSWQGGRLLFKRPRELRAPVRVLFGRPMPPGARAHEVRAAIQQLSVEAFRARKAGQRPLEAEFLRTAKRFWRRRFLSDSGGTTLRFGETLVRALALRRELFDGDDGAPGDGVGILLPHGVDGALANLAVLAAGRAVVNLDADAGAEGVRRQIAAARLDRVVTTQAFLSRLGLTEATAGVRIVDLERARRRLGGTALRSLRLRCRLAPAFWLERGLRRGAEDVERIAAIVFSDAPQLAGETRAVVLSHHNILSNMESLKQVFRVSREDRVLGLLPFGNPFGLFATLLLPAVVGVPVVYHDDPDDVAGIGRLAREVGITLVPIPTSRLEGLVEKLPRGALSDLRHVVVAGGRLTPELRDRFAEAFGVEPLEGFGCAECAPLVSLNVPTLVEGSHGQIARRTGTSGHPLPGIAVRIVDPRSGRELPPGHAGELWVRGANVMQRYLGDAELTSRALVDGWFRTGRVASQDEDGFLTIQPAPAPGAVG